MSELKLKSKLTLISGGSSGIGLAMAHQVFQEGSSLILIARDSEKLAAAKADLIQEKVLPDQFVETLSVDMRNFADLEKSLRPLLSQTSVPDYAMHSAGVVHPAIFEELSVEQFHWMMDTNYFAAVNLFQIIVPLMKERRSGHIIAMGSASSFISIWGYTAYSGSKYAIRGLMEGLRSELKPYNVFASIVFPPDTDTPQLAYENQFKPEITKHISGTIKPLPAEFVAKKIFQGVMKKQYQIIPDSDTKLTYTGAHLLGTWMFKILDIVTNQAIRRYGLPPVNPKQKDLK